MPLSPDTPTVLWTLRKGAKQLACSVQLLPHSLEVHLVFNGDTPYCSRTFHTQDELLAWAEEQRVQTLAEGQYLDPTPRVLNLEGQVDRDDR